MISYLPEVDLQNRVHPTFSLPMHWQKTDESCLCQKLGLADIYWINEENVFNSANELTVHLLPGLNHFRGHTESGVDV
jgi:hypothetical protein